MKLNLEKKILQLRDNLDDADIFLGPPATEEDIATLVSNSRLQLFEELPGEYIEFLKSYDGLASSGVFIYSSRAHKFSDSCSCSHDFIEWNLLSRDLEFIKGFLIFGDSDQDEYVLDLSENIFQVRDKQAFDNVFEEFESFYGLLEFMIDLIIQRSLLYKE